MALDINELRAYLDPRLEALEKTIRDITGPILKDTERLRVDINDLYEKHRDILVDAGKIDGRIKTLEDDKDDKKMSSQNIIMIIALMASVIVATVGWIL